jgi:phenylpyruvate tautomerase PptA (4-oxalocrotonate tautomerase family)
MPLLDVTFPAGALPAEARQPLLDELTTLVLRAERAPDNEFFRSIVWIYLNEMPAENVVADGKPAANFRLLLTLPEGALSDRRRQEFVETTTRAVREAAGIPEEHALRVWVLINEVPDGNWGAAGNVIRFEQLKAMAAQAREETAV